MTAPPPGPSAPLTLTGVCPAPGREWDAPVDLTVQRGEWVTVRTTPARSEPLLRICVGLLAAARGTVDVLGQDPGRLPNAALGAFRRQLGAALQPDGLVSNLDVRRNLVVSLVYAGVCGPEEALARADEGLTAFELTPWAEARPAELPEDVRSVVAVVRAVVRRPALLVLEDPLAAVKSVQAEGLLRRCRRLAPTALVTTFRRNAPLYEAADRILLWDSRGLFPAEGAT